MYVKNKLKVKKKKNTDTQQQQEAHNCSAETARVTRGARHRPSQPARVDRSDFFSLANFFPDFVEKEKKRFPLLVS